MKSESKELLQFEDIKRVIDIDSDIRTKKMLLP